MKPSASQSEPCDVCGAVDALTSWLEVSLCGIWNRSIQRCTACGFRQVRPRLSSVELAWMYSDTYFDPAAAFGYGDYARETQRRAREAYFLARRLKHTAQSRRVLEVGCALGFLLAPLVREGWDVRGVDASAFAAYYARTRFNLSVACGTLKDARFPDNSFDFVIQKDLLEHVSHPRQHLLETVRIMRPGAELWLITPNGEANLRPLEALCLTVGDGDRGRLPLLDQGHLSFFAESHLLRLFKQCGLECVSARAIGVRRGLRALGYLPGQRRFARLGPRTTAPPPTLDLRPDHDRFEPLSARIDAEVARRHRRIRTWMPYYYYRRLLKRLDTLPAWSALGYDFEFWLRKT